MGRKSPKLKKTTQSRKIILEKKRSSEMKEKKSKSGKNEMEQKTENDVQKVKK